MQNNKQAVKATKRVNEGVGKQISRLKNSFLTFTAIITNLEKTIINEQRHLGNRNQQSSK